MVEIDTLVLAREQKKKLIDSQTLSDVSPTEDGSSPNSSDIRFKIVYPHPKNRCSKLMFSILNFASKHPVVCIISVILWVVCLICLWPFLCCIRYALFTCLNVDTAIKDFCFIDTRTHFKYTVTTAKIRDISVMYHCTSVNDTDRIDCLTQGDINKKQCAKKGCCWALPKNRSLHAPHCFYPSDYRSYKFINVSATDMGAVAFMKIKINSTYPRNIPIVKMDFNYRTEDILEVKVYDPMQARFEPPFPELPNMGPSAAKNTKYVVDIDKDKFGFRIVRKSNNKTIFNAQDVGGFVFSDQLLQMSARLPSSNIYGLGQQRNNFLLDLWWNKITLFNHDKPPKDGNNLYGSHPFYLAMEEGGLSDGVLLLNSNAMDVVLSPSPAITYRAIGGILDFFVFLGPSPADVLRQYTQLVGRPFLPPYWSLGFHLCRFGHKTLNETINVWNRTRSAGIPFDTQWNDIDYMENRNDFTYDKERFKGLPEFVDLLHKEGMHYMVIVDPGISADELPGAYPPFDQGIAQQVFISDASGYRPFTGKVWNKGSTVFVDFFKPAAVAYWMEQLRRLHKMFPYDGAWIDMNDPSNFLNGTTIGCPNTTLDEPPYLPAVDGHKLYFRTLCMSAKHRGGVAHYNLHNVYSLAEALVTSFAMQQIRGKRAFVISRSSFTGHGRYAGVWTGDISSSWDDMAHSVSDVLSFSLFGIPMSGADICGFNGNATPALCERWSQLGAFYPFSRNHNSDQSKDQDPVALGPAVTEAARKTLLTRYSLLPYLYTLFWQAHSQGDTVARPMFVEFPEDNITYSLNTQFLWGPALLIAPVLIEGALEVNVYLPAGRWYDYYTSCPTQSRGTLYVVPAPLDTIPLMLRGGYIVVTQRPELTTTHSRSNPMDLLVALDDKGQAEGQLYWDDGESLDHNDGVYNLMKFTATDMKLQTEVEQWRYNNATLVVGDVKVLGVESAVQEVTVDGKIVLYKYNPVNKMLLVKNLYLDLSKMFKLIWK